MSATTEKVVEFPSGLTHDELRERVRATIEAEGLSQAAAAREADVSAATFSQWMSGEYKGDRNRIGGKLLSWLNSRAESSRLAALMPVAPTWVEAPTARRIWNALSYAQMAADIAVVYGGAGLSKTTTIARYREKNPNVWVVTSTPATASVGVMLEETALSMGLRDFPLHPARLQRAILKQLTGSRGLLIYDEAQHLTKQALEAARALHDQSQVGLAFAGNASVFNRMYGGGDNGFAQLYSRVGKRVALVRPLAGDVHAMAGAFGVNGKAEREELEKIARRPGALRMVVKTVRLASVLAAGEAVAVPHIRAALNELQGVEPAEGGSDA